MITVFYEPETAAGIGGKPHRDFAYQLVKRGFVTLSLGTVKQLKQDILHLLPSIENATIQPLSTLAYAAANAWYTLAKVKDVDSKRIGIVGHSYGGNGPCLLPVCLRSSLAACG